ncbi:MAG: DUF3857 and transglutaminase domain-containing protein, partial [Lentisphaeria bacterium]|nr:DUF3857 and transglutaminase domain-containing protein [Lentisphaeria bacterium]
MTTLLALDWNDDKKGFLSLESLQKAATGTTCEKYPDADTVEIDNVQVIEYQNDGKYIQVMDHAVKVMTQAGTDSMRVLNSYYSASYSRAKISLVQVLKANGEITTLDLKDCTQEMIEPSQMSSNIYDPSHKIISVSLPDIQPGDTIRSIYVDEIFKPRVPNAFADFFQLEDTAPSLHTKIVIDAPKDLPLKKIAVKDPQNGGPTFSKTEDGNRITYTWELGEVKQFFSEPAMPGASNYLQRLLISTFDSWEQVSRWYDDLCEKRLVADDEIKNAVTDLVRNAKDDMEKIMSLYNFVSQKGRYMGLTLADTAPGYEPHDVTLTFKQRAGVCRDMAALLASMLRCAGFDAHPVLIQVGDRKDEEVPIYFFNHAITAVRHPETGEWMLMDPTNTNTMEPFPAYLSENSYLVATPEGDPIRLSPVSPYQNNLIDISTTAKISMDGSLQADSTLSFKGIMDNAYRNGLLSMQADERRLFFERKIAEAVPNAKLTALKITPENLQDMTTNVKVDVAFQIQNCLVAKIKKDGTPECVPGNVAMFKIPSLNGSFGLNMLVFRQATLDKRRFPLKAGNTAGVTENISVDLPEEMELVGNIEYSSIDNENFTISRKMKPRRNRVDIDAVYASKVMPSSCLYQFRVF